eukprot:gnl/MRDRNA2_/MRDRNA2_97413_c0_seq1.p1 gnl/MRDRNA2_/MRDRNA2_97413_c0~~gnl/MRDRNA2_/MRDRNA2_97413_c0_seq1.p1  ORF type:complete len:1039 (-),score=276.94 gnl/MRDRNA2_/MRDRNA2_97413_c0_seq1:77-3193(-)
METDSQVPAPDSESEDDRRIRIVKNSKSKRGRMAHVNDENSAPAGEEDGKAKASKRAKTGKGKSSLRHAQSLQEMNGDKALEKALDDADADAAAQRFVRIQKQGSRTRVCLEDKGDSPGGGDPETPGKSSDGESPDITARFRATKKSGKNKGDFMNSPDQDAKESWMLELGWTKLDFLEEEDESVLQEEDKRRRTSYSIRDKKHVIARLPIDRFLGKKSLKQGGRPLFDDDKKVNLHFLIGLYKELQKDDGVAGEEDHMKVRFLVREAVRLRIITSAEANRGRIPADRLKKVALCGYNLNHSGAQVKEADPDADSGAEESLISSTTAKALQELRFPSKKRVVQPKPPPKEQESGLPDHKPLGQDAQDVAHKTDDNDDGSIDSEDERRAQRERLGVMSGSLRSRANDRRNQILTADANKVDLEDAADQLMGPSLSFDWGNNDEEDDLQIEAPGEKGKTDMRKLMQDELRRKMQQQKAQKWSRQKSSDSITTKSSRQKSSESLDQTVSEVAALDGAMPPAGAEKVELAEPVKSKDKQLSVGADEVQEKSSQDGSEVPAAPNSETTISPTAPWTGDNESQDTGIPVQTESKGIPMTEPAASTNQTRAVSEVEPCISPTAPWTGVSPTAAWPGTAMSEEVEQKTAPPASSKGDSCISPTAPWTGVSPTAPWQGTSAEDAPKKQPPTTCKAGASISPTAPWMGITPTAPWQGTAPEKEGTLTTNSPGPTAMWGRNIEWDTPPPEKKARVADGNTTAALSPTAPFAEEVIAEKDGAEEEEVDPGQFAGLLASPVCEDIKDEEPIEKAESMSQEELARANLDEYLLREKGPQKRQTNLKSIFQKRDSNSQDGKEEDLQPVVATPKAAVRPWSTSPVVFESPLASGQGLQKRLEEAQGNPPPPLLGVSESAGDHTEEEASDEEDGLEADVVLDERQRAQLLREREWRRQQRRRDREERKRLQKEQARLAVGQIRAERAISLGTNTMSAEDRKRWEAAFDVQDSTATGVAGPTSRKRTAPPASQDDTSHLFGIVSKKSKGGLLGKKR